MQKRVRLSVVMLLGACFFVAVVHLPAAQQNSTPGNQGQSARLKQLLADEWEYELRESPELATSIGDYRYNDRWSDSSLAV